MKHALFLVLVASSALKPQLAQAHEGTYKKNLTFNGPITGDTITYTLYLPPGHDASKGPYPLIVFLHGAGGGNASADVCNSYEQARRAGLIGDFVVVFPEKYGGTVWRDGAKDKRPETNVLKELLPMLEKKHSVYSNRAKRTIMGFSMGAAGSIFWGGKHLDTFSTAVALDAGGGTSATDAEVRNYVPQYATRTDEIRKSLSIRFVQGGMNTTKFRQSLDALKIPYELAELPKDVADFQDQSCCLNRKDPTKKFLHNPTCMTAGQWGQDSWAFIQQNTQ